MIIIKSTESTHILEDRSLNLYYQKFKEKFKQENTFQSVVFLAILFPIYVIFVFSSQGFDIGVNIILNGIINGASLALLALGFSIIFGVARMFKLSLGGYFVLGAYTAFWLTRVSELNVNNIVKRPIVEEGSVNFTILNLRIIHALPFLIFALGLVYLTIRLGKVKGIYFIILNLLAFIIQRELVVSQFGTFSEQATFHSMMMAGSIILISIGLLYFELSDLQVTITATVLTLLLILLNLTSISDKSPGLYVAILIYSMIFVALISMIVDRYLLDDIRSNPTNVLIVTFGVALLIQSILAEVSFPIDRDVENTEFEPFGVVSRGLNSMVPKVDNVVVFGTVVQSIRIVAMIGSIILIVATLLFINKTQIGLAMKAVSQDVDAAWLAGIDVRKVYLVSTGLGMALAAAAGILISPYDTRPFWGVFMGWYPLVIAIAVVTVGGLGSVMGSVVAGFIIGFAQSYISQIDPQQAIIVPFIVILITMIFRPEGLFGIPEENE
ncbi:MAG: ABC transporter permease subunit [Candidatus Kariarchaeaceae archaeon]